MLFVIQGRPKFLKPKIRNNSENPEFLYLTSFHESLQVSLMKKENPPKHYCVGEKKEEGAREKSRASNLFQKSRQTHREKRETVSVKSKIKRSSQE